MSAGAVVHSLSVTAITEANFRIAPPEAAGASWTSMVASHPEAKLYHRARWLEVLRRAYGLRPLLASIGDGESILAGCLVAPGGLLSGRRMVALPFSDFCPPLAIDDSARDALLAAMARNSWQTPGMEIRGVAAPGPWRTSDHFQNWRVDLGGSFASIYKRIYRDFRHQAREARDAQVTVERAHDNEAIKSFFAMQLRTRRRQGLPAQPLKFFKIVRDVFAPAGCLDVWIARHRGRQVAAVLTLRDGDVVYMKWSARASECPNGASHLLQMSLIEEHAGKARYLDLGRADSRNRGLAQFKRHMGGEASPLPCSYIPEIPAVTSSENLNGVWAMASSVWRNLPLPVTRGVGALTYRYLG